MKKEEEKKIANFNAMMDEISKDVEKQVAAEKEIAETTFNEKTQIRNSIMNKIWMVITKKILGAFKVKITLYYNEKIVFEYVIPKD